MTDRERIRSLEDRVERLEEGILERSQLLYYAQYPTLEDGTPLRPSSYTLPTSGPILGIYRAVRNRYKKKVT